MDEKRLAVVLEMCNDRWMRKWPWKLCYTSTQQLWQHVVLWVQACLGYRGKPCLRNKLKIHQESPPQITLDKNEKLALLVKEVFYKREYTRELYVLALCGGGAWRILETECILPFFFSKAYFSTLLSSQWYHWRHYYVNTLEPSFASWECYGLNVFLRFIYFMLHVWCFAYMCVYHLCVWCLWRSEEDTISSGFEIMAVVSHHVDAGTLTGSSIRVSGALC